jgi:hypothetical protein
VNEEEEQRNRQNRKTLDANKKDQNVAQTRQKRMDGRTEPASSVWFRRSIRRIWNSVVFVRGKRSETATEADRDGLKRMQTIHRRLEGIWKESANSFESGSEQRNERTATPTAKQVVRRRRHDIGRFRRLARFEVTEI